MALTDIVNVSISTESARVERAGYGVPLILAADTPVDFTERVRFYASMSELDDDFASTTATYKMAAAVFAQDPGLPRVAVGRLANKPTQRWAVTPIAANSVDFEMEFNGEAISYTSDGSATVAEIIAGLKADIDALSLAVTVSDQTTYMRIVANTAGATFSVESLDLTKIKVEQDHADPGLATDLSAILDEDDSWYCILCPFNSKACVNAIADWTETNKKFFLAQTQESNVVTLADGSDTGGSQTVAGLMKSEGNFRTALIYHPNNWAFADGAWAGKCLPFDPGSETWKFKTLSGVETTVLTSTYKTNAHAKYVNTYSTIAGVNMTENGTVSGNEWIDVIRFRDWLESGMEEDVFELLATANGKVPYTDAGIAMVEGVVRARLRLGVQVGGLAADPEPRVTVPAVSSVSDADKAARILRNVKFDAVLAGAIQATTISGNVTV